MITKPPKTMAKIVGRVGGGGEDPDVFGGTGKRESGKTGKTGRVGCQAGVGVASEMTAARIKPMCSDVHTIRSTGRSHIFGATVHVRYSYNNTVDHST